jgi:hypothetical protein
MSIFLFLIQFVQFMSYVSNIPSSHFGIIRHIPFPIAMVFVLKFRLVCLELFLSNLLSPLERLPTFRKVSLVVGLHLEPLDRLVGPTLVWSLPFDLIGLVRPVRGLFPRRHPSQDPRDTQALSPQGK